MKGVVLAVAAGAVVFANGYLHGVWTNRWEQPIELINAIGNMKRIPMTMGSWEGQDKSLGEGAAEAGGFQSYCLRTYVEQSTKKEISMLLMCGRPGPVSVHPPDVCYRAAGYVLQGSTNKVVESKAEFMQGNFVKKDVAFPTQLRICWAWAGDGAWVAPVEPRITFARYASLYKLYLVQEMTQAGEKADLKAYNDFLEELMPALDKALFANKADAPGQ
jgi:hypothetical protein